MVNFAHRPILFMYLQVSLLLNFLPQAVLSQSNNLFTDIEAFNSKQIERFNRLINAETTIALRTVSINSSLLDNSDSVILNLFPSATFTVQRSEIDWRGPNKFIWHGEAHDKPSSIMFSVCENSITGTFIIGRDLFRVIPLGDALHAVVHLDQSKRKVCTTESQVGVAASKQIELTPELGSVSLANTSSSAQPDVIKVLMVYTPQARSQAGSEQNILNEIQLAEAAANQSYDLDDTDPTNDIPLELDVVYATEINYTETSEREAFTSKCEELGTCVITNKLKALKQLQDPDDGIMDDVHDLRGIHAADVVVLVTSNILDVSGEAFEIGASTEDAFCIIEWDKLADPGGWSLPHEVGHLQGLRHENDLN